MLPETEYNRIRDALTSLRSYSKRIQWAKDQGYDYIGSGSARSVFSLDEDTVIKIAKNEFGLSQNQTEGDYGLCHMYSSILAKVVYSDDETYTFIVSEKAHEVVKSASGLPRFFKNQGVDFKEFKKITDYLDAYLRGNTKNTIGIISRTEFDDLVTKYNQVPIVVEMVDMCINFNLLPGDFTRFSSWGLVKQSNGKEKVCLKDFGLTVENHQRFILDKLEERHKKHRNAFRGW